MDDDRLERYGAEEVAEFLTERALTDGVAASTQNPTLMIYTHVMNRPGLAVTSPLDRLREQPAGFRVG